MKIQKRLLLYVGGTALILFFFVFHLFILLVANGLAQAEDAYALRTVNRFDSAIVEKEDFLSRMAFDWAVWDDTYNFVNGDSPKYIESNINKETFENFGINSIIIINNSGEIGFEGYYDLENHTEMNLSAEQISGIHKSLAEVRKYTFMKGLASINSRIVVFSSHRVSTSDNEKDSNGYLVFAKYFDSADLKTIGNYVGPNVNVTVVSSLYHSSDYKNGAVEIAPGIYKKYLENDYVECMREVYDVGGARIGVAHIIFYRGDYVRIMGDINSFLIALTACLIIVGTIFFVVLQKTIVERVQRLNSLIFNILDSEDLSKRVDERGNDEISSMSASFNQLLEIVNADRKTTIEKNKELSKANRDLKRLDELKTQFLSNVSHETRTPLTAIQAYTQILNDGMLGPVNAKQKEALGVILTSSKSLNEILSEILDASKYDSGNVVLSKKQVNLHDLLSGVRKEFDPAFSEINGTMKIEMDRSLSAYVDEEKMSQVFRNLVGNSVKYRSEWDLVITLKAERRGDEIFISLRDNGVGINEEGVKHLFERFYRDSGTSNKVDGAGLGLSIARSIIELHGGKIKVESRYKEYTEFKITIPVNKK